MKKKYILIIVVIAVILLYPALRSPDSENVSIMDVISSAPAVKLAIEPSEGIPESEWIYRFTYNPKEKVINGTETVVLFGSDSLSINGELYKTQDGVDYEKILEWAENTYNYYSAE